MKKRFRNTFTVLSVFVLSFLIFCFTAYASGQSENTASLSKRSVSSAEKSEAGFRAALADGGTVTLSEDITITGEPVLINCNVTIDLNGKTITDKLPETVTEGRDIKLYAINITTPGKLVIKDSSKEKTGIFRTWKGIQVTGALDKDSDKESLVSTPACFELESGTIEATNTCVGVFGKGGAFTMNGGKLVTHIDDRSPVAGGISKKNNGTEININSGEITAHGKNSVAIYHPHKGRLSVTGGIISGYDGIHFQSGELVITGGEIHSYGEKPANLNRDNTYTKTGAALSFVSNSSTSEMSLDISGNAVLKADKSCALFEDDRTFKTTLFKISGGSFTGFEKNGTTPSALLLKRRTASDSVTAVTGGTYNSDPSQYINTDNFYAKVNGDTTFTVLPCRAPAPESFTISVSDMVITKNEEAERDLELSAGVYDIKEEYISAEAENSAIARVRVEKVAEGNSFTGKYRLYVTPLSAGETTITVALNGTDKKAAFRVKIDSDYKYTKPEALATLSGEMSIYIGEKASQLIKITPENGSYDEKYEYITLEAAAGVTAAELKTKAGEKAGTRELVITGMAEGTETVTLKLQDLGGAPIAETKIKVHSYYREPEGMTVTPGSLTLKAGENATVKAQLKPVNAAFRPGASFLSYSSDNEAVAMVNKNGKVTAVSEGSASITVTLTKSNGSATVEAVSIPVTVIKEESVQPEPSGPDKPAPTPTPADNGGTGGCSAGFAGISLLALLPLLKREYN